MPQHHPSDFVVPIAAEIVERILALHSQSRLRSLVLGLTLTFRQSCPLANNLGSASAAWAAVAALVLLNCAFDPILQLAISCRELFRYFRNDFITV